MEGFNAAAGIGMAFRGDSAIPFFDLIFRWFSGGMKLKHIAPRFPGFGGKLCEAQEGTFHDLCPSMPLDGPKRSQRSRYCRQVISYTVVLIDGHALRLAFLFPINGDTGVLWLFLVAAGCPERGKGEIRGNQGIIDAHGPEFSKNTVIGFGNAQFSGACPLLDAIRIDMRLPPETRFFPIYGALPASRPT